MAASPRETEGDTALSLPDTCQVRSVDPARVARGRALLHDDAVYVRLAEVFHTLADPSRARIVYSLLQQELCVCDLAAIVGLSDSAVSQHLRVLRNLRLVRKRRQGKSVYYSLDDAHIRVLVDVALSHLLHADERELRELREPGELGESGDLERAVQAQGVTRADPPNSPDPSVPSVPSVPATRA